MRLKSYIFLVLLLVVGSVYGQSTNAGGVNGTVTDSSGAALPGVTVELSGAAMQGTRTVVTDGSGQYRFVNIPPGENYNLSVNLSGFAPVAKTLSRVYLGQEATVDVSLRASVTEAITVTAEAPLVDVSNTTTGTNVTSRQFDSLPTQRSFQQLTTLAPGVNMEMGASRSNQLGNSPSVGSSSAPENNYIIDGLSTTDARYGTSGTNLTMNFVEEVQVMTGGYPAEFGRSTGGVFNVITKSGSNAFRGDVFGYLSDRNWSTERVGREQKGTNFNADLTTSKDLGFSLGGPIMRDRLWFFGAFNPSRRTTQVGVASPLIGDAARTYDTDSNNYAAKLTFALTANHSVVATAFGDPTTLDGWLIRGITATPADATSALRKADVGSDNYNIRYNGILSPKFLIEANLGQHKRDNNLGPATTIGATVPRQIDTTVGGGYQRGGFMRSAIEQSQRDAYSLKASNYFSKHSFRYGVDVENNQYVANTHEPWFNYYGTPALSRLVGECRNAAGPIPCIRLEERNYSVDGSGKTENEAAFLQDQWKVMPNFTLNLGVRYERQRMGSTRGVFLATDPEQINTGDYTNPKNFTLDNNWAPRLGFVWDPMNNGKSKIYGFAGRFFEAVPLDLNIRALNGEDYLIYEYQHLCAGSCTADQTSVWFNPNGYAVPASVRSGGVNAGTVNGWTKTRARNLTAATATPLSADLKAQYQDEIVLGGEYQFGTVWSGGVRLVDRELKRVIEDFGVFTDPTDPTILTGYAIANPGEGILGSPYPKPKRYYRAAEFTVQRAFRDNWQLMASYVYAQAKGNYEGLFQTGYEQLDPNITSLYDIPSFLNNSYGKLRSDRPVNFKVHGSYRLPMGLTLSEGFYFSSGIPISVLGPDESNGYGDSTIFLKSRGSNGRTPNFYQLDLHADWALPLFKGTSRGLSVILDVFNVTDAKKVLEVDQDYIYDGILGDPAYAGWLNNVDDTGNPVFSPNLPASPYYNTPALFQSPRTVQLGAKFTF